MGGILVEKGLVIVERSIGHRIQSYGGICIYKEIPWNRHGDYTVNNSVEQPHCACPVVHGNPIGIWPDTTNKLCPCTRRMRIVVTKITKRIAITGNR